MRSAQLTHTLSQLTGRRPFSWTIGLFFFLFCVHFAFTGIWSVQENEKGIVTRFGVKCRIVYPGLVFTLPWPFETLLVVNTEETQKLPVGFQFGEKRATNEKEWLTGDMNIVDLEMMIHYTVSAPSNYLFRVGPAYAEELIRKCAESVLTEIIAVKSVDVILTTDKYEIEKDTQTKTQVLLDHFKAGITISRANLRTISPPRMVIAAFKDVSSAKADREKAIQEADGYRKSLIPTARTQADQVLQQAFIYADRNVSEALGRTERFRSILGEYKCTKEITRSRLFFESMGKTLDLPKKILTAPDATGESRIKIIR